MSNLKVALSYQKKGVSVIPLYSEEILKNRPPEWYLESLNKALAKNAKQDDPLSENEVGQKMLIEQCKIPIVKWKEYQTRIPTEEEVTQWFTENPQANIGIVTGKVSGIVVFDLDSEEGVKYSKSKGGFPKTPAVKTGKGYHFYMKHPGFVVMNNVNKKLTIDIRGDGGQVAAPPSIHGSGRKYEWLEGHSIFDIEPAECTPWMIEYLKEISDGEKKQVPPKSKGDKVKEDSTTSTEYADILKNGCGEGERNDKATKLLGHLFKKGLDGKEVLEIVKTWNEKNRPPLSERELMTTYDSVKKMESRNDRPKIHVSSYLDNIPDILSEYKRDYVRIPFGRDNLSSLEEKMNGGLMGGNLYIFGGIPSSGKTVLTNCISDNLCINGYPVLFFSYDDGRTDLRYRTFTRFSEYFIDAFNTNSLSKEIVKGICEDSIIKKIRSIKYVVEELIRVEQWDEYVDQIKEKHGKAPVIIVDYLRKLRTGKKVLDERLRVDDIVSKLTGLAKRYNIPILAISELARDSYKTGQRLSMASFKETGIIEYEASWLGIMAAVEEDKGGYKIKTNWEKIIQHDGNVDLIVFKAKRGTGDTGRIPLKVNKSKMTVLSRETPKDDQLLEFKPKQSKFG